VIESQPARQATAEAPRANARRAVATPAMLNALADAISSESRLLDELVSIMQRQRSAVSTDNLEEVDDSVYATHRVLLTLGQARQRRRSINRLIADDDDLALRQLEELLGGTLPDPLQTARESLRQSAATLEREVEVNRRVLRSALAHGETFVRTLLGVDGSTPYPVAKTMSDRPSGGFLVNRVG
jgi:hypothetical protein